MSKYEIITGKNAGFCFGVKRAVDGALEKLNKKDKLYCLGEIVHNGQVVNELKDKGLVFIEDIKEAKGTTLIRAHGVEEKIYRYAKENNIELYDYTCPKVLVVHNIAKEYCNKGYYIILLGSKTHPENIGTISYCGKDSCICETIEDVDNALEKLKSSGVKKLAVIAQTTFNLKKFYAIESYIKEKLDSKIELDVKNTICKATEDRQKETEEISKSVDFMIIIGGKNSSNTKKLYEIASKNCKAICIETADELDMSKLENIKKIGIMAGASTPQKSIDEVISKIDNN